MGVLEKLQEDVADLRETKGNHDAQLKAMTIALESISAEMKTLVATMNRGRGALFAIICISSVLGALVADFIGWVRH